MTPHGTKDSGSAPSEVSEGGGAPEITDDMVEAGVSVFLGYDSRFEMPQDCVLEIFEAMQAKAKGYSK